MRANYRGGCLPVRRGVLIGSRFRVAADATEAGAEAQAARSLLGCGFAIASSLNAGDPDWLFAACLANDWERGANWIVASAVGQVGSGSQPHFRQRTSLREVWAAERGATVFAAVGELQRRLARRPPQRLVLTNGVFDVLHLGHLRTLSQARGLGDRLVVALNTDASARGIKRQPTNSQFARAALLAALDPVDYVVLFDQPDPRSIIRALRPAVLTKGGDYAPAEVVGADLVRPWGGEVVVTPFEPGFSSSAILDRQA